jgi:hypothetical protein
LQPTTNHRFSLLNLQQEKRTLATPTNISCVPWKKSPSQPTTKCIDLSSKSANATAHQKHMKLGQKSFLESVVDIVSMCVN